MWIIFIILTLLSGPVFAQAGAGYSGTGAQGPAGPPGATGAQGPQGPAGGAAPNTVDATLQAGSDVCAKMSAAAIALFNSSPAGGTISAGFSGVQACGQNMWGPWVGTSPTIPKGTYFPVTVLWGSFALPANASPLNAVLPPGVVIRLSSPIEGQPYGFGSPVPFVAPAIVSGATYAVPSGGAGTACTVTAPCTVAQAQTNSHAGGNAATVYLRSGACATVAPCTTRSNFSLTGGGIGIHFFAADNNTTWTFYPPDGVNSPVLDGGALTDFAFEIEQASVITISGLTIQNFISGGVEINGYAGVPATGTITNNIMTGLSFTTNGNTAFIAAFNLTPNDIFIGNAFINSTARGVNIGTGCCLSAYNANNAVIANNVFINICTIVTDCGPIYLQDTGTLIPNSTNIVIANNYMRDQGMAVTAGSKNAFGIYLDDGVSNAYVSGNIVSGVNRACTQIHGGNNNIYYGNICDLGTTTGIGIVNYFQTGANNPPDIVTTAITNVGSATLTLFSAAPANGTIVTDTTLGCGVGIPEGTTILSGGGTISPVLSANVVGTPVGNGNTISFAPASQTMAGNVFKNNIIIANTSSSTTGGHGTSGCPPTPLSLSNNDYFQYGIAAPISTTGNAGIGADTPQSYPPLFSSAAYILDPASPVYASPISFPVLNGGHWGPPGWTMPVYGTSTSFITPNVVNGGESVVDGGIVVTAWTKTFPNGPGRIIYKIQPAGTLGNGTITTAATPPDGQEECFISTQIQTNLTWTANTGQSITSSPTGPIAAGSMACIGFSSLTMAWTTRLANIRD